MIMKHNKTKCNKTKCACTALTKELHVTVKIISQWLGQQMVPAKGGPPAFLTRENVKVEPLR